MWSRRICKAIMPIHIVKKEAEEEDEGDDESVESGGEGEESGEESEIDRRDSEYQQSSEDRDRMDPNDSEYRPSDSSGEGKHVRSVRCEFCGYTCRQKVSLNWHMKKNDVELSYSFCCELCGKWFKSKLNLHFHKGKSHPRLKSHRQKDRQTERKPRDRLHPD
ncbi:transcriptional repressor CTCF-like [Acipenser ruthenus]|uniref:transcriptional repressor CTCF-like n=1 Tax=Acipenser ruthenus TaxID=7906 RepID=UPI00145C0E85|nr:transcriptional repressor CTCF-like [Acipenser ruthenus]XP_034779992.2 transcriptional repressor CTCF-like [Acipenser ruthenus]